MSELGLASTRFLFFTGKGGVGKTTLACATAIALADGGMRTLLVSTDPASNLDEMLEVSLSSAPTPVPGVRNLLALNIDPGAAAETYRERVLAQLAPGTSDTARAAVREQLSGACTTEIAAFDEFVGLLTVELGFDKVVFDTAPTGHTLRLLSLPKAWAGFLKDNDRGASCLGPHSGLKMQEARFRAALAALGDPEQTTIVLVARPESAAIREAARTSMELGALGLRNQQLAINGIFSATDRTDVTALAIEALGRAALADMPPELQTLPQMRVPLQAFDMVGLDTLRRVLKPAPRPPRSGPTPEVPNQPGLASLADALAAAGHGLIMVMGKGGVGKTTVAAALAVGLVQRGHQVHLSTTDPAAHVKAAVGSELPGLLLDRIDPKAETERYVAKVMASRKDLDADGLALLREDLESPCTEEVAVFHAFSRIVAEARAAFVVLDTAPTGHTLLLMDATGAYHRQMMRDFAPDAHGRIVTPLMRLQDPDHTKVVLVTLPEITPVSEAAALQEDLRRAGIDPYAWVVNRTLLGTGTRDPVLCARLKGEQAQIRRVESQLAQRLYLVPWQPTPPAGEALRDLAASGSESSRPR